MKKLLIISAVSVIALAGAFFAWRKISGPELIKEPIPSAEPYQSPVPTSSPNVTPKTSVTPAPVNTNSLNIKAEVNLAIPFTSQAPFKNWGLPYAEFCEEASSLMVAAFINGWTIPTPDFADQKMLEIKAFEEQRFGYYKDTTAEETAIILREFYHLTKVQVLYNPTINDIKKANSDGKAVMAPMAGRLLGNPYFQSPGPIYHMLVIKGYTKEGNIITNDPGTRNGANFIYSPDVIMKANHDWNAQDILQGRKVIIIVG